MESRKGKTIKRFLPSFILENHRDCQYLKEMSFPLKVFWEK
jgi:hypothetical protein